MTCSVSCCVCDPLIDLWNMCVYIYICVLCMYCIQCGYSWNGQSSAEHIELDKQY